MWRRNADLNMEIRPDSKCEQFNLRLKMTRIPTFLFIQFLYNWHLLCVCVRVCTLEGQAALWHRQVYEALQAHVRRDKSEGCCGYRTVFRPVTHWFVLSHHHHHQFTVSEFVVVGLKQRICCFSLLLLMLLEEFVCWTKWEWRAALICVSVCSCCWWMKELLRFTEL